ncbi:hypothetical protein ACIQBJ_23965 [Kitasatospora sp. NPDC088391]|uniref:hypothetical protein n=1 Tax=Kitasatospora sp. NPDC088391 TaxID=3364074 RepID=UPI00381E7E7E
MASTTPGTEDRPATTARDGRDERSERTARPLAAPVPMRALLASCRAAAAVSTPPERDAA